MQMKYEEEGKRAKEIANTIPPIKSRGFDPLSYVQNKLQKKPVVVFSKTTCPYCQYAFDLEM